MDQSSMSHMTGIASLSALLLIVAGVSLLGHVGLEYRSEIARRIDDLLRGRGEKSKRTPGPVVAKAHDRLNKGAMALPIRDQGELERLLRPLGISPRWSNVAFLAIRFVLGASLAVMLAAVGSRYFIAFPMAFRLAVFAFVGGALGLYLPTVGLRVLAGRRVDSVERALPDAIELLVVAVEAGIALEDGIEKISVELRRSQPALADELAAVAADLKLLPNQRDALMNFADRVDRPSVRAVMTTLAQTMQYGTPLAQALRVTSAELRSDMMLNLEAQANRMPVLLTIPMVVFLLPAIFLVVGGPAILRLVDVMFR